MSDGPRVLVVNDEHLDVARRVARLLGRELPFSVVADSPVVLRWPNMPMLLRDAFREHTACKPMKNEGISQPHKFGAKPSAYRPCPNGAPRCGSKRKRQWR